MAPTIVSYMCMCVSEYLIIPSVYMKLVYQRLGKSVIVHGVDFTYENSEFVSIKHVISSEAPGRSLTSLSQCRHLAVGLFL